MTAALLVLRSRRTVTPQGIVDAVVTVRDGRITSVRPASGSQVTGALDLGEQVLMPGLVDTHVHINEPGRTDWEGFASATRAAAAGGVTTLVDMPLNSIPATTTVAALRAKKSAAQGQCRVDVGFWGGVVPGNAGELEPLARAGVLGFKCFLVPSGVDEFPCVQESDLRAAMPIIAELGLPLLVHAELPGPIDRALAACEGVELRSYATWLASRPAAAEVEAIRLMIGLAQQYRCPVHVVHLSAAEALSDLIRAREQGIAISVETCPHYLCLSAEEIEDGATLFKCAPPIRDRENRDRLWTALESGAIDMIASDHSPCPPAMKHLESGDFMAAWGGIASLELGLPAVWKEACARALGPAEIARWMCEQPARLAGLDHRKGRIAEGFDADLVVWEPDFEWCVDPTRLQQRHPTTPYAGRRVLGRVVQTYVRGRLVYDGGAFTDEASGRPLSAAR